jgi:hypothetical protein
VTICGIDADASKCRGTTSEPPPPPPPQPALRQVYRLYYAAAYDHLWSLSTTDGAPYYRLEGGTFKLYAEGGSGRAPLYRCFVPNRIGHFLSLDAGCEGTGVWNEGLLGYVATSGGAGRQQLYRCHQQVSATRLHFLTTPHQSECTQSGHTVSGGQGYAPL